MAEQLDPDVAQLLARAVEGVGGEPRDGQFEMAKAVAAAMSGGRHLLVQAGTGTGKSLAYLVPALCHTMSDDDDAGPVVVATATIALQRQLVDRDLPRLVESIGPALPRTPSFAILKDAGITCACSGSTPGRRTSRPSCSTARLLRASRRRRPPALGWRSPGSVTGRTTRRPATATNSFRA
ncbi:MAG TPA: DEAD/DEAH box helicase [Acidothermaceae bacterium]|nr:DEAD/DEAH box helicase [Acidothermaceae bacterium]